MAQVLIEKPSRIHNLSYLLLGYYLSSLITYDVNLSLEQKIAVIIALGSFVGTLVYYIKPVERMVSTYFRLTKKNQSYPEPPYEELAIPVYKSEVFYSGHLQDERTKINGAFFLAIGIVTSGRLLQSIGLSILYLFIQIFTAALILAGFWEIYDVVKRKVPRIVFLYNYYNVSEHTQELEKAIESKDWIKADKIIEKEPELDNPDFYYAYAPSKKPEKGLCLTCGKVRETEFCTECGEKILKTCPKCNAGLVKNDETDLPKYCGNCGAAIEEWVKESMRHSSKAKEEKEEEDTT